jgi:endonuclease/exonuclease/phosphatase family metal-dependent hydrolase
MSLLSIATLNVCNFCAPPFNYYDIESAYSDAQWQAKTDWLTLLITQQMPDIICFQEVFSVDHLISTLKPLGYHYWAYTDKTGVDKINPYLLNKPIVVIASLFPIKSVQTVESPSFLTMAPLSRKIVKCTVKHPDFGLIRVYGCHLKSKRATDISEYTENLFDKNNIQESKLAYEIGQNISNKQRDDEALTLYIDYLVTQKKELLPSFILGDFNQQVTDSCLSFISEDTDSKQSLCLDFTLLDCFYLSENPTRDPTHYYQGCGNTLDYILCSESILSQLGLNSLDLYVVDQHISHDFVNTASDHAMVIARLK